MSIDILAWGILFFDPTYLHFRSSKKEAVFERHTTYFLGFQMDIPFSRVLFFSLGGFMSLYLALINFKSWLVSHSMSQIVTI